MRRLPFLFCAVTAIALEAMQSCGIMPETECGGFYKVPEEGLEEGTVMTFTFPETDSIEKDKALFDVILVVRYTNRFDRQSVLFNIEELSLESETPDSITVEVPLFADGGKAVGKGNFGLYEVADTLHRNVRVPEGYTISVSPSGSACATAGLNRVGVMLK